MAAIRCRHCGTPFPISLRDLAIWHSVPEFRCPQCDSHMRVSTPASLLTTAASVGLTVALVIAVRRAMHADGRLDGVETFLLFNIGFGVAYLVTLGCAWLFHALFGTLLVEVER